MKDDKRTPKTAEDLLRFLDGADLKANRRRDLKSAINRASEMARVAPTALPVDPVALRGILQQIRPAAHGLKQKTWSNVRSLLGASLHIAGLADPMGQGLAQQSPAWAPLLLSIRENKRLSHGLAAFANWCVTNGISPEGVDDAAVQRFLSRLETRTLCPRPRDVARRVPKLWNEAREKFEAWPRQQLSALSFRAPRQRLSWEDLSESVQVDAQAYLKMRAEPDVFDERPNAPRRPLAQSTLHQQSEHLRLSASVVVESGIPLKEISCLADLVQPERFKTILRYYHERGNGQPNAFAVSLAKTLIQVAKYHVGASEDELRRLKAIANKLPAVPRDLTEKNKALLRELKSERRRAKLLFLPEELISEVTKTLATARVDFVKAQVAIAVDILLATPLRPQNLSRLNWARYFSEPDGPNGPTLLHIPKVETKSGKQDYDAEIPNHVARRLRWYRRHILPSLNADPSGDLFVTAKGKRKLQDTLTDQMIRVIENYVGIHMTPHQFRHFCAVSYLEANPEDTETARALLGHTSSKMTRIYVGSGSQRASRAYNQFVFEQRDALKLKAERRPRRKIRKGAA
jgi:integrase